MAAACLSVAWFTNQKVVRWFMWRHCRNIRLLTRHVLGCKIELRGLEQFSNGDRPAIIASKHQSEFDVWPPIELYPDLSAIAMAELSRYPLIGPMMRKLDYITVSLEGGRKNQLDQVLEGARQAQEKNRPILIYPEGELMKIGARKRYRSGIWHIYNELQAPVTPVALNCGLAWPQRRWRKRPRQHIVIEFLPPIEPGLPQNEFMALIEQTLEDESMRLIREHGAPEDVELAELRYRHKLNNDEDPTRAAQAAEAASS